MNTKWSEKTLAQKVRYVFQEVLFFTAFIFLVLSFFEIWDYGLKPYFISISISNILRYWDSAKAGESRSKIHFLMWLILLIAVIILL